MQEALEWRRVAEANGNLTRRFEETRAELEKTLRVGQACLTERGDPAELFSKHSVRHPVAHQQRAGLVIVPFFYDMQMTG